MTFGHLLSGLSQERFELGESHFDRIEVRASTAAGSEAVAPAGLDGCLDCCALVGREVVEDDDVARAQGWCENLRA